MENQGTRSLTRGKKLLLTVAGTGVLIVPVFAGMISASQSPAVAVREMQLPVLAQPVLALPALSQVPTPSARQTLPVPAVQAEPQPSSVRVVGLPVIEQATSAGLPVLSQAPGTTLSQTQVQELPTVGNNVLDLLSVLPGFRPSPSPQQIPAPPTGQAVNGPQKWLDDVSIIITDAERIAFQRLTKDSERQGFINNFWLARDPTPGTPANEFKEEYDRRIAYANEHFTTPSGIPGSKTDRGKMYILNGPPDEIVSHPSGGTFYRPAEQGGGVTNTYPFDTWRYRQMNGKVVNVIYEFVDKQMNGEYSLEYDPGAKSK